MPPTGADAPKGNQDEAQIHFLGRSGGADAGDYALQQRGSHRATTAILPGTVSNVQAVTIFSSEVITTDQQSTALDISPYQGGDLFVTVDVDTDSALTTTLQFSGDGTNFANCYWKATKSDGTFTSNTCQIIQTAGGTSYTRAALAGQYGRLDLDVTGTVTVTAVLVQRNN